MLLLSLALLGALVIASWTWTRTDRLNFLPAHHPAKWIIYPTPVDAEASAPVEVPTEFRCGFSLPEPVPAAMLSICGFKRFLVRLNGEPLTPIASGTRNWKHLSQYQVARLLRPGTNELAVTVTCSNGLPALWVYLRAGELKLISDESWESSIAGASWKPAQAATAPLPNRPGNRLFIPERPISSVRRKWWVFVLLALAASGLAAIRRKFSASARMALGGAVILTLAWSALWANNLGVLPGGQGFDAAEHLHYIQYILDHGTLPLANEGWEMYQPPLYYVVASGVLKLAHLSTISTTGIDVLRVFGLLCGVSTFWLAFLSLRLVLPAKLRGQVLGLLLAALLPVNLYLYQYITNETLAATLVAAAVYLCLRILARNGESDLKEYALLGLVLGLALLTKSSTLLAVLAVLVALAWHRWRERNGTAMNWFWRFGALVLVCIGVCGWHYYRTMIHFGNPLLGNWDPRSGFNWWQEPGYRVSGNFWSFGQCLRRPFYSAFAGIPDGLYSTLWGDGLAGGAADLRVRPPWNYDLMAAGYLFALVPAAVIFLGVFAFVLEFVRRPDSTGVLMLGTAFLALLALAYYTLEVPSYAAAKAFYVLPALVPLCVFGGAGLEVLSRKAGKWRALIYIAIAFWALNVYGSFWILRSAPATRILLARSFAAQNEQAAAVAEVKAVLDKYPDNSTAGQLLAIENARLHKLSEAEALARTAIANAPDDPEAHLVLGTILFQQGKVEPAISEARRTLVLAPDHPKADSSLFAWLYESGRKTEAAAACAESLRIDPFNAQLHFGMARVARDLGDPNTAAVQARIAEELSRAEQRRLRFSSTTNGRE